MGSELPSIFGGLCWQACFTHGPFCPRCVCVPQALWPREKGLLQWPSCVWCRAVGSTGRHWSAFPQRILTTTRLVGRTCLSCIALVVFDGLHGSSITPIKISALFRSGWGDVIAIPCGSLVLTVSPVGTARIWKCFALYFNIHIG